MSTTHDLSEDLGQSRRKADATRGSVTAPAAEHPVHTLQRAVGNAAVTAEFQREEDERSPVFDIVGKGGGRSLPTDMQRSMQSKLGADFSDVRIHDDSSARASAAAVGAHAYTNRHEVVLGDGVDLSSHGGQKTLVHELTHVVQQSQGPVAGTPTGDGVSISDPGDSFEREAESNAERVMSGGHVLLSASGPVAGFVQREEDEEIDDDAAKNLQMEPVQRQASDEDDVNEM